MDKNKKYIFFDIDGTIYRNGVIEDAKQTILKLKENGHKVFICTGRAIAAIDREILELEFDGIVAACGLYIQVGDEVIKNILLAEEILEKVKRTIIKKDKFFPVFEGCNNIYYSFKHAPEEEWDRYRHFMQANADKIKNFANPEEIKDINKFGFRTVNNSSPDEVYEALGNYFDIMYHGRNVYEAVPFGFDKGTGMLEVLNMFGADVVNSIAVGDSINDVPMFKKAGYSILIGEYDRVKEYVDMISDPLLECGVSNAFKNLGLI